MKRSRLLSNINLTDAKEVISSVYPEHFRSIHKWKLKDISMDMGAPCKCLKEKNLAFEFYFFVDAIIVSIDCPLEFNLHTWNKFNRLRCENKAKELGYRDSFKL